MARQILLAGTHCVLSPNTSSQCPFLPLSPCGHFVTGKEGEEGGGGERPPDSLLRTGRCKGAQVFSVFPSSSEIPARRGSCEPCVKSSSEPKGKKERVMKFKQQRWEHPLRPLQALPSAPPHPAPSHTSCLLVTNLVGSPSKGWRCSIVWALRHDCGPRRQRPELAGGFTQSLNCVSVFSGSTPAQLRLRGTGAAGGCWEIQLLSPGVCT